MCKKKFNEKEYDKVNVNCKLRLNLLSCKCFRKNPKLTTSLLIYNKVNKGYSERSSGVWIVCINIKEATI